MFVITFTFSGAFFKSDLDQWWSDYNHFKSYLSHYKVILATESDHSDFKSYLSHHKSEPLKKKWSQRL